MTPIAAIKTCFSNSLKFSGRASRSEFWWFFPIGLSASIFVVWFLLPHFYDLSGPYGIILNFFLLLPVWAAGARRLQDTGEDGQQIFIPAAIFFGGPLAIYLFYGISWLIVFFTNSFIALVTLALIGVFIAIPMVFVSLVASVGLLGPIIGQLIVPSERKDNRYGKYDGSAHG
ncbi:DUF805 domain-containing protein [Yoonia sp. 208BN28-4]|uniref:DUF805 domain-containing protein n=1 Tax=Yoonia sp. 208BN28-4 TaxID=3126505 RepID=UPI0030ADB19D